MNDKAESLPTDPKRVKAFVSFFKNYMSVSSVVVAALPIPLTAFNALPIFADYKTSLSTYTSLFCFLTLGFIFYSRHSLAKLMFPEFVSSKKLKIRAELIVYANLLVGILPLILIVLSGILVYFYHYYLDQAVYEIARTIAKPIDPTVIDCSNYYSEELALKCYVPSPSEILADSYYEINGGLWIRSFYVGMLLCAEAAFILMATKEYIQDLFQLSDLEIIQGERFKNA